MKIAVAMSGGVDSSLSAALLKEQGHEVIGFTMLIAGHNVSSGAVSARQVAEHIGIEHHIVDLWDVVSSTIVPRFCHEYQSGRTPNACVWCNRLLKFGVLFDNMVELGAERIATGHYARVECRGDGRYLLRKGADGNKDQSYFLHALSQQQLSKAVFPLGR